MSAYANLVLIAVLLVLGAYIALRSGSGAVAERTGADGSEMRLVAGNFSALLLRVLVYLAVLAALQGLVGFPKMFLW
jgi:hypothetical protein